MVAQPTARWYTLIIPQPRPCVNTWGYRLKCSWGYRLKCSYNTKKSLSVFQLRLNLFFPNNFEPLIPMRNLIFLSHSFLIESDIRTFSAFQDQSSAVLSMCINRLKVTSCGFQFLSQHLYIFFLFTYDRRASKRKLIVITLEHVFRNQDITRIFNRRKHFCHSCIENVLIVN